MKDEFHCQIKNYTGNAFSSDKFKITAEIVSLAVLKINKGKAPGCDGIMIEHLLHCHPIIACQDF